MKQLPFFSLLILSVISCSSDQDDTWELDTDHMIQSCNEEEMTIVHVLSEDIQTYISTYVENEKIEFVNVQQEDDVWTWERSKTELNRINRIFYDIPCEEDSTIMKQVFAQRSFSYIQYDDDKNDQTFRIVIGGVIERAEGIPVGVLGETIEVRRSSNNTTRAYHIINYLFSDEEDTYDYPCSPGSRFYETFDVGGITLTDVLTMEVPGENDHYRAYFNKEKGLVLMQELKTGTIYRSTDLDI